MRNMKRMVICLLLVITMIAITASSTLATDARTTVTIGGEEITLNYSLSHIVGDCHTQASISTNYSGTHYSTRVFIHLTYYNSSFNVVYSTSSYDINYSLCETNYPSDAKYVVADYTWELPGKTVTRQLSGFMTIVN